ncbi:MAG: hypothetical protein KAI76_02850 [Alphaproteobacteria bacterium]|nr:hypothetical protein [Alphaproteobacteria bacterium]
MFDINTTYRGERGNALFLILIAVALFAALSYAITQSGRGGGTVDKEQALITAASICEYPATLRTAVTRMLITGTAGTGASGIDVDGTTLTNELFSATGGGASVNPPPSGVGSSITAWTFLDATHATNGFYVTDVGTNADFTGREVLAVLGDDAAATLSLTVCQQINKGLGQVTPYQPAFLTAVVAWDTPGVNYAGAGTLTGAANAGDQYAANVTGNPFSCISNALTAVAPFNYYHALVEQ